MSEEEIAREQLCGTVKSLFERGLTHCSTVNISVCVDDGGWLMTPTGSLLGTWNSAKISKLNVNGRHLSGDKPTSEAFLHATMYDQRPTSRAVVILHSTYSVVVSCLRDIDQHNYLLLITTYYAMRIGKLPLAPNNPPGDEALAEAAGDLGSEHHAVLLANHGPVVAGNCLSAAIDAIEELEGTARLFLVLHGQRSRTLTDEQVEELQHRFKS